MIRRRNFEALPAGIKSLPCLMIRVDSDFKKHEHIFPWQNRFDHVSWLIQL